MPLVVVVVLIVVGLVVEQGDRLLVGMAHAQMPQQTALQIPDLVGVVVDIPTTQPLGMGATVQMVL
jgi:hypothetical protein